MCVCLRARARACVCVCEWVHARARIRACVQKPSNSPSTIEKKEEKKNPQSFVINTYPPHIKYVFLIISVQRNSSSNSEPC